MHHGFHTDEVFSSSHRFSAASFERRARREISYIFTSTPRWPAIVNVGRSFRIGPALTKPHNHKGKKCRGELSSKLKKKKRKEKKRGKICSLRAEVLPTANKVRSDSFQREQCRGDKQPARSHWNECEGADVWERFRRSLSRFPVQIALLQKG